MSKRPGYIGGVLNTTGVRPGNAFQYEGPAFPKQVYFVQTITSTHDAIERLVVPPPLKVDRDMPPEIQIMYFTNIGNLGYDGRQASYQACMFMARVKHGDISGRAGWEFVDNTHGDKTEIDLMMPWGVYFGMLKKLADIRFYPVGVNEFEMTVTRRGIRLVTMRIGLGQALSSEAVLEMNALNAKSGDTLLVREIPNETYSGFVDRAICRARSGDNFMSKAWSAEQGPVSFGHAELDPLDELPVLGVDKAIVFELRTEKELFTTVDVVERLALEVEETKRERLLAS
ncbi:acetoacetate decarboxylase family protein [Agrobacterium radiobacter]|uniref:acetoacetate decarboxylase family protein n=1 Tax=Agrobacterium radiobacter TaxID=362 RepID=UPI003F8610E2